MASHPEENNWNRRTQPFPIPPEQLQFGEMFFSKQEFVTAKGSASERFGRFTPSRIYVKSMHHFKTKHGTRSVFGEAPLNLYGYPGGQRR